MNSVANGGFLKEGPVQKLHPTCGARCRTLLWGCGFLMANEGRTTRLPFDEATPFYGPEFKRTPQEILAALERVVSRFSFLREREHHRPGEKKKKAMSTQKISGPFGIRPRGSWQPKPALQTREMDKQSNV